MESAGIMKSDSKCGGQELRSTNDSAVNFLLFAFILFGGASYILWNIKLVGNRRNVSVSVLFVALDHGLICYQHTICIAFQAQDFGLWIMD